MTDLLPLTMRLLAAWPRFREATSDREEQTVVQWCGLDRSEVGALLKLRDQWREAGPIEGWFAAPGKLRPGVLAAVLDGFDWREDAERLIARAFGAMQQGEHALLEGLARERKRRAMTGAELRERVEEEVRHRGIDLIEPPGGLTKELAQAIGANATVVSTIVAALKREARAMAFRPAAVGTPAVTANGNGAREEIAARYVSPPSDPLRALRAVLLEEGLKGVEPEALREPLRRLLTEGGA